MSFNPLSAITTGFAVLSAIGVLKAGGTTQPIRLGSGWYTISQVTVDKPKA